MRQNNCTGHIISAATQLFAHKGFHGVGVRELARAAGVNPAMISYYFGGKDGLYAAVLEEQFAGLNLAAHIAQLDITPWEKFKAYVYQCGICFHEGDDMEFRPTTASANHKAPECPKCLNNDSLSFSKLELTKKKSA